MQTLRRPAAGSDLLFIRHKATSGEMFIENISPLVLPLTGLLNALRPCSVVILPAK